MLKIAICCGGGFSSSALAAHLDQEIKDLELDKNYKFVFIPIGQLLKRMDEVEIAMVCPHMEYRVRKEAPQYTIPVTIIPPRLYGLMSAQYFIEDAVDLLELWNAGAKNMITFPDEPRPLAVKRLVSHRRHLAGETHQF